MIETLLILFVIAFIFDGIKILIETIGKGEAYKGTGLRDQTTALVSVYNNPEIIDTIYSIKSEFKHIVVINDGSDDEWTRDLLMALGTTLSEDKTEHGKIYIKKVDDTYVKFIDNEKNLGKVSAIHSGLQHVTLKYTFICDDDIRFSEEFELPVSLLEDDIADAVSFFVLPEENDTKMWYNIQLHEYIKSMQIGRRFAGNSKSVECVSGCAGLFKTQRLKDLAPEHSSEWEGEDLERTLIELINQGRVIYSDEVLFTAVPTSFMGITKQRVFGWWGGLYRNIPKFWKILRSKASQKRLRFETFYNIISLILDPLKFISLFYLAITMNYVVLGLLYLIYAVFELYIYNRYKGMTPYKPKLGYVMMYPLYGFLNLIYRMSAGIYMAYRKFRKVFLTAVILILSLSSFALAQDKDYIVDYTHQAYRLGQDGTNPHVSLYLGYDKYYITGNYGLYDQVSVGMYHNNWLFDLAYRKNTITPYVLYEHWLGNNTIRGHLRYNYNYGDINTTIYPNTTVVGAGYGRYEGDTRYILDVFQELDRNYSTTIVGKTKQKLLKDLYLTVVGSVNLDNHYMYSGQLELRGLYVGYTDYSNYDYTGKEFVSYIIGYKLRF